MLSFSNSPSLKTLLMCLVITERSLWNSDEICACVSHTVSFSTRTSSRMVSSGWYITISPLMPDSMLCILSNLEFNTLLGTKVIIIPDTTKSIRQNLHFLFSFRQNQSPFRPFVANHLPCRNKRMRKSVNPLGLAPNPRIFESVLIHIAFGFSYLVSDFLFHIELICLLERERGLQGCRPRSLFLVFGEAPGACGINSNSTRKIWKYE
ncbi:hypothetical protein SAMN04487902_1124 [Prevotella sp. ne3005]|nr:hypothetical protein SAMN04487902_1124 [Prevotella sp. ne3005]